jgi:hypothetical protein
MYIDHIDNYDSGNDSIDTETIENICTEYQRQYPRCHGIPLTEIATWNVHNA